MKPIQLFLLRWAAILLVLILAWGLRARAVNLLLQRALLERMLYGDPGDSA